MLVVEYQKVTLQKEEFNQFLSTNDRFCLIENIFYVIIRLWILKKT